MGFSSYAGAGIGQGLQDASNTLLQIQMAKYIMANEKQNNQVVQRYNKSRADMQDLQLKNLEASTQAYLDQQHKQGIFQAGVQAGSGGDLSPDSIQDNGSQDNSQSQGSPVAGFSSVSNGNGALPQEKAPQQQTQWVMGASGKPFQKVISQGAAGATSQQDVQLAVKGVAEGKLPPEKVASYRDQTRVNAEFEREGINLSDLQLEWDATRKSVQTMNGLQQIRLRQSINFGLKSTNDIIKMSDDLTRGPNPIMNRMQLNAAKQGLLGPQMQQKATLLDQQIADTVSDLGQVYMGGNSPTDKGLDLAKENLSGDWSAPQLKAAAQNIQKLLNFRLNSVNNVQAEVPGGEVKGTYGKGAVKDDSTPSPDDLEFTAKQYGMSVDEVKEKLGIE